MSSVPSFGSIKIHLRNWPEPGFGNRLILVKADLTRMYGLPLRQFRTKENPKLSAVAKLGLAFFRKGRHTLFLILGRKQRLKQTALVIETLRKAHLE